MHTQKIDSFNQKHQDSEHICELVKHIMTNMYIVTRIWKLTKVNGIEI
jgi:hypothetical protein